MSDFFTSDSFASRNHAFEPELQLSTPRPLPEFISRGKYEVRRRQQAKHWIAASLVCLVLVFMPFTDKLSYNLLPLGYLEWIGLGCVLVSAIITAARLLKIGRYRYIKHGVPVAARVTAVEKVPLTVTNGVPTTYCYAVTAETNHPETGLSTQIAFKSPGFPAAKKDEYVTLLRPDQYVTALYLPGRFSKSLKLYGFLELNPEIDFVQRTGESAKKANLGVEALKIVGLCSFFVALFGMLYTTSHYWPVEDNDPLILAAGLAAGLPIMALTFVLWAWSERRRKRVTAGHLAEAAAAGESPSEEKTGVVKRNGLKVFFLKLLAALGFGLLGAFTVLGGLFAANALFDESNPEYRLVKISEFTQTTYNLVYRTYQIEYEYPSSRDKKTFSTTYEQIMKFEYDIGLIELHRGRFGWSWVKNISPFDPEQLVAEDEQT